MSLRAMLIRHEGLRLKAYTCTAGKTTIGVGRNLDDVGITHEEAMLLLEHDISRCLAEAERVFRPWWRELDEPRRAALLDMLFNLGVSRLLGFKRFLAAMAAKDYEAAAREMLDSTWAAQVKGRAVELAAMIRTGQYQEA